MTSQYEAINMNFKRIKNVKNTKMLFIIACEGAVTEHSYFDAIVKELIASNKILPESIVLITDIKNKHTNPSGVLYDLLNYEHNNKKNGMAYTYKDFDEKWIVIDRDEKMTGGGGHDLADFNNALSNSEKENVSVAWSNPCFEIWFLLHFDYIITPFNRVAVFQKLKERFPEYEKNNKNTYTLLKDKTTLAIRYAKKLENENIEKNAADSNPGTMVHKLVEKLLSQN